MPRLPNNSDRDFWPVKAKTISMPMSQNHLLLSRFPGRYFADPIVRMRIATLITEAVNRPKTPQRVRDAPVFA